MFSFFKKDPVKRLKERYGELLEQAMLAQRKGDIETYSRLTAESEEVYKEIEKLGGSV